MKHKSVKNVAVVIVVKNTSYVDCEIVHAESYQKRCSVGQGIEFGPVKFVFNHFVREFLRNQFAIMTVVFLVLQIAEFVHIIQLRFEIRSTEGCGEFAADVYKHAVFLL